MHWNNNENYKHVCYRTIPNTSEVRETGVEGLPPRPARRRPPAGRIYRAPTRAPRLTLLRHRIARLSYDRDTTRYINCESVAYKTWFLEWEYIAAPKNQEDVTPSQRNISGRGIVSCIWAWRGVQWKRGSWPAGVSSRSSRLRRASRRPHRRWRGSCLALGVRHRLCSRPRNPALDHQSPYISSVRPSGSSMTNRIYCAPSAKRDSSSRCAPRTHCPRTQYCRQTITCMQSPCGRRVKVCTICVVY